MVVPDERDFSRYGLGCGIHGLFSSCSEARAFGPVPFFRLCADFDLYPTFLTRAGVKKCFEKVAGQVSLLCFLCALHYFSVYFFTEY